MKKSAGRCHSDTVLQTNHVWKLSCECNSQHKTHLEGCGAVGHGAACNALDRETLDVCKGSAYCALCKCICLCMPSTTGHHISITLYTLGSCEYNGSCTFCADALECNVCTIEDTCNNSTVSKNNCREVCNVLCIGGRTGNGTGYCKTCGEVGGSGAEGSLMCTVECIVDCLEEINDVDGARAYKIVCLTVGENGCGNLSLGLSNNVVLESDCLLVPRAGGHGTVSVAKNCLGYGSGGIELGAVCTNLILNNVEAAENDLAFAVGNDGCNGFVKLAICEVFGYNYTDCERVVLFYGSSGGRGGVVILLVTSNERGCEKNDCNE